ncbi:family 16 glycosylhydrolase [Marinifilum sp. RC60d5]|uniref:family 16 glycosylhydrolase n=1 Tax=Marinifilum sp. RC60d5 TaxID=3458414 RepID=UPI0040353E52
MSGFKNNVTAMLFILFVFAFGFLSCSSTGGDDEEEYTASFEYELDASNPNVINLTNTSVGDYLYLQWNYGNGTTSSKETDKTSVRSIHYPQKGTYDISLTVWGNLNTLSDTKTVTHSITIEDNDTDYIEGETLVWSDEFDGTSVNMNNWTFETGDNGWGNNELQNYTNGDNAHIADGKLILTAEKINDNKTTGSYTSTRMITWGKQEFTYGRIEVKAKLPSGTGIWPAIWMLGANLDSYGWPACGEIDIMEYVGYQPNTVHATVHTSAASGADGNGSSKELETCEEEFHVYGMIWDANKIQFYIDTENNITHTYSPTTKTAKNWPFDKPQFFILNVAVGGNWGGAQGIDNTIFPQTMEVDYVRVYQ